MIQNLDKEEENNEHFNETELKISSEENFDWDWIFDKGWLRIKK
ncbi:MAG: hypothetical protein ACFFBH_07595 [Promethearchaeota archaeon]